MLSLLQMEINLVATRQRHIFAPTELSNTSKIVPSDKEKKGHIEKLHGFTKGYQDGTRVLFVHEAERLLKDHYYVSNRLQRLREKVGSCERELGYN